MCSANIEQFKLMKNKELSSENLRQRFVNLVQYNMYFVMLEPPVRKSRRRSHNQHDLYLMNETCQKVFQSC